MASLAIKTERLRINFGSTPNQNKSLHKSTLTSITRRDNINDALRQKLTIQEVCKWQKR
jgi:hypothetical protein